MEGARNESGSDVALKVAGFRNADIVVVFEFGGKESGDGTASGFVEALPGGG